MRSPMTRTPSILTGTVGVQTILTGAYRRGAGTLPARASFSTRIYAGEVPQQPPKIVTPVSSRGTRAAANASGPRS